MTAANAAEGLDSLDVELERWRRAGLISSDQATSIHEFEAHRPPSSRTSLVVEVLVYLGVAAVLGSAIALVAQQWDEFGVAGRLAFFLVLATTSGVGGWLLRGSENTPGTRAGSVLWLVSVAFAVGAGAVVADEYAPDRWQTPLIVAGPAWLLASRYWQSERRPLQLLAATVTFVPVVLAGVDLVFGEITPTSAGTTMAVIGLIGIGVTPKGWVPPRRFAELFYALVLLFGLTTMAGQPNALWAEVLGVLVAAGLLALSVNVRSVRFLGAGGVALFIFATMIIMRHFAERIGVPVSLLVSGIGLIGAAILVARLRPLTKAAR